MLEAFDVLEVLDLDLAAAKFCQPASGPREALLLVAEHELECAIFRFGSLSGITLRYSIRLFNGLSQLIVETPVETCSLVIVCVSDCVRVRSRDC